MVYEFETFKDDKRIVVLQSMEVSYKVSDQSTDRSITGHDLLLTYKQYLNT